MKFPPLTDIPVPDTMELRGKDAFEALVEHFDFAIEDTIPMGLDIIPTEEDKQRERLRRAGLLPDVNLADVWEHAR
jgi:hypothetical protein